MVAIQQQVGDLLREGESWDHPLTATTGSNLLKRNPALWTFVRVEGVQPTNHAAEQAVRSGVLWRKCSFGTHSTDGSRFVERMMMVVATLKQQKRNVLDSLFAVCSAQIRGENVPSFLSTQYPPATHCVVP
jgi:transposase